jgi:hypothetical protein
LRINAVAKGNSQRLNTKAGLGKGPVLWLQMPERQ